MRAGKQRLSRRGFLRCVGGTGAALAVVPRHVLGAAGGTPPSEKLNVACIGVGGRGGANVDGVSGENVVALCDVDAQRGAQARKRFPNVPFYQDFRKLLDEKDKGIDAVTVSTPDHTHAVAVVAAMKRGKHVYCEKPLAEIALLGVIATRLLGRTLAWDGPRMRFTNCDEANAMVSPPLRAGWTL